MSQQDQSPTGLFINISNHSVRFAARPCRGCGADPPEEPSPPSAPFSLLSQLRYPLPQVLLPALVGTGLRLGSTSD